MSLKKKLFEFQKVHFRIWKNAEAGKDSKWGYKYATLDKIWDVIQDKMDELQILESSSIKYNDSGEVFVYTSLWDVEDEDWDAMCSLFPIDKELSPQDIGKAITYGRRYNLVALLNLKIVGEDDDAQWIGGRKKAINGDKFVDTVINNNNVEKAKTLFEKIEAGEYSVSDAKLNALVSFIDSNDK